MALEDLPALYPPAEFSMFIAVGYRRMNRFRAERYEQARTMGYELITHVSPRASTWPGLEVGDNCLVMDQVVITLLPVSATTSSCGAEATSDTTRSSATNASCHRTRSSPAT